MSSELRPSGTYAHRQGRSFEAVVLRDGVNLQAQADTAPAGFEASSRGPGWWALRVGTDELEALDAVTTYARWRGHECQVLALLDGGRVLLSDDGADRDWAEANAEFREPGVWDAVAPVGELEGVREEARDLLSTAPRR